MINAKHLFKSDSTGNLVLDQLGLISNSEDNERGIHIYVMNSRFKELELPINLGPNQNILVELILYDYNSPADTTFGINDDWNYFGIINDFLVSKYDSQGYVEGTFGGTISTRTGKSLNVTTGSFRIKIKETEIVVVTNIGDQRSDLAMINVIVELLKI